MHDATKVLLGSTQSSAKDVSMFESSPVTYLAGLAVRRASDGGLSLLKTAGMWVGVSLGKSLSDHLKTAVVRSGEKLPIMLDGVQASGTITITDFADLVSGTADTVEVAGVVFTAQAGAATPGDATFQAATTDEATAISLAAQINAHAVASLLVIASVVGDAVTVKALAGGTGGNALTLIYDDNDTNVGLTVSGAGTLAGGAATYAHAVIGAPVYISDTTGKAVASGSGATVSNATYVSASLSGINEAGETVPVAMIDMPGGL